MNDKLIGLDVDTLYIVGLALDYCVFYSAKDAIGLGFKVYVVEDATRGISPEGISNAKQDMKDSGIKIIQSSEILSEKKKLCKKNYLLSIDFLHLVILRYLLFHCHEWTIGIFITGTYEITIQAKNQRVVSLWVGIQFNSPSYGAHNSKGN